MVLNRDHFPGIGWHLVLYGLMLSHEQVHGLFHCSSYIIIRLSPILSSISSSSVFLLCLTFLLLFDSLSLVLSCLPLVLSVFKSPQLYTLSHMNFIDSLQSQVVVDRVEQIEFVLDNNWVFYIYNY